MCVHTRQARTQGERARRGIEPLPSTAGHIDLQQQFAILQTGPDKAARASLSRRSCPRRRGPGRDAARGKEGITEPADQRDCGRLALLQENRDTDPIVAFIARESSG